MRFGSRESGPLSLGKFGMGLKLASLSYCQSMKVVTRKAGRNSWLSWTIEEE